MARQKTGIVELDAMLRGGFLERDAVMIAGSAGTGKTTLSLQHLVNGITKFGDAGIYLTFEQLPDQIYRDAENFGWDLKKLEDQNKFRLVCTSPDLLLEPDGAGQLLDSTIKEIQPRRMVIDSLNHLEMYLSHGGDMRKEAYRVLNYVKTKGISPLAIWETQQSAGTAFSVTDVGMSFLVDCILLLKFVEIDSAMRKALVIMKMRGSDHDKELKEYAITPQGFKIGGGFSEYEGVMSGSPHRVASERFVDMFQKASEKHKGATSH
jgi:circadian clock protein KaiC